VTYPGIFRRREDPSPEEGLGGAAGGRGAGTWGIVGRGKTLTPTKRLLSSPSAAYGEEPTPLRYRRRPKKNAPQGHRHQKKKVQRLHRGPDFVQSGRQMRYAKKSSCASKESQQSTTNSTNYWSAKPRAIEISHTTAQQSTSRQAMKKYFQLKSA